MESSHVATLATILTDCTEFLNNKDMDIDHTREEILNCMTEVYRCLRNSCVSCRENQDLVTSHPKCLHCTRSLITTAIDPLTQHSNRQQLLILLRCAVQFLGNYVSGHFENGKSVWELFSDCFR